MAEGLHGMVGGDAKVVAVTDGHPARTCGLGFSDGDLHGPGGHHKPQAGIAIDNGSGRRFMHHLDVWLGIDAPGFPEAHIPGKSGHSMRVNPPQVRRQQGGSGRLGIGRRTTHCKKDTSYKRLQRRIGEFLIHMGKNS